MKKGDFINMIDNYFIPGRTLNDPDEHNSYKGLLEETFETELETAGIRSEFLKASAMYFYLLYKLKQSIILCGASGIDIANAISATVSGKLAAVLDCSCSYSRDLFENVKNSDEDIIVVKNIFMSDWLVPITEYIQERKKYIIVIHPFIDDLMIEPRDLFEYIWPVITNVIVAEKQDGKIYGGTFDKDYKDIEIRELKKEVDPLIKKLNLCGITEKNISIALNETKIYDEVKGVEFSYLGIYYPFAYITGRMNIVEDAIINDKRVSRNIRNKIISLGSGVE